MNAKKMFIAITVLAAAASAFAGNVNPFPDQKQSNSDKTRAQVQAELLQAQKQGWIVGGQESNYSNSAQTRDAQASMHDSTPSGKAEMANQMQSMMQHCHAMMMKS